MMMMMWNMFHYIHTQRTIPQQSSPQKPTSKFIDRNLHCSRALDGNAPTEIIFESSEWVSMENFPMVFRLKWNHGVGCFGREMRCIYRQVKLGAQLMTTMMMKVCGEESWFSTFMPSTTHSNANANNVHRVVEGEEWEWNKIARADVRSHW